jgi:hypothetical protein
VGIFSIVAMGVARLIFLNRNMVNEISSRMNVDTLHAQIFSQLLDNQSCFNTFESITKAANQTLTTVKDNNIVLASALPVFTVGNRYVTNVTLKSITLNNYVSDATTLHLPFNSIFELSIVYSVPYDGTVKDFPRTMLIRTANPAYPGGWADGVPLANATVKCISATPPNSTLAGSGVNLGENISKKYADTKDSDFFIRQSLDATPIPGKLIVNGDLVTRGYFQISDQFAKTDIKKLNHDTEKFNKIKGYRFKWKDTGRDDIGFKAQELRRIYPEIVGKSSTTDFYSVDYFSYVPVLLENLKKLDEQNSKLEKEIAILEERKNRNL